MEIHRRHLAKRSAVLLGLLGLACGGAIQVAAQQQDSLVKRPEPEDKPHSNIRIVAPDGTPLAGTLVSLNMSSKTNSRNYSGQTTKEGFISLPEGYTSGRWTLLAQVQDVGFALARNAEVRAQMAGGATAARIRLVDLRLQPGATLRIRAREQVMLPGRRKRIVEQAVGGAQVSLSLMVKPGDEMPGATVPRAEAPPWVVAPAGARRQAPMLEVPVPYERVTDDGSGEVELNGLPPGVYQVTLRAVSGYAPAMAKAEVSAEEENDLLIYMTRSSVAPAYLVVQDEAGKPWKNSELTLRLQPVSREARTNNWNSGYEWQLRRALTNVRGECILYPLRPGLWQVSALDDDFEIKGTQIEVRELGDEPGKAEQDEVPILVARRRQPSPGPNGQVRSARKSPPGWPATNIRILAPNGQPLRNTPISINLGNKSGGFGTEGLMLNDQGFVPLPFDDSVQDSLLKSGTYLISVYAESAGVGFLQEAQVSAAGGAVVNLRLKSGGALRVLARERVLVPGERRKTGEQEVGNATVRVRLLPDEKQDAGKEAKAPDMVIHSVLAPVVSKQTRDGDGLANLKNLPPGRYEVTVNSLSDYATAVETVEIVSGETSSLPVYLTRNALASLRLKVQDAKGNPVRGAEMRLSFQSSLPDPNMDGMQQRWALTNNKGECVLYPVKTGRWNVSYQVEGYHPKPVEQNTGRLNGAGAGAPGVWSSQQVEVEVLPEGAEALIVVEANGTPADGGATQRSRRRRVR